MGSFDKNPHPNRIRPMEEMPKRGRTNEEFIADETDGMTPRAAEHFAKLWLNATRDDVLVDFNERFINGSLSDDEMEAYRKYMETTGLKQSNWTSSFYGANYQELWDSPRFHDLVKEAYASDPVKFHDAAMILYRNYGIQLD